MPGFQRIQIEGYRRLRDVDVEMRDLAFLIGANGVGKTSFLEVWSLLAASCGGDLSDRLNELSGLNEVMTCDTKDGVKCTLEMPAEQYGPLKYELHLEPWAQTYRIAEEVLSQVRDQPTRPFLHLTAKGEYVHYFDTNTHGLIEPTWEHNPRETSLSQVPKMFKEPEDFRRQLGSLVSYAALDISPNSPVRLPQQLRPADLPGKNGEDLISCLFQLRELNHDRFEALKDTLSAAFPDFERLDFPPAAAGMLSMTWKDRHFKKPMYMHQLSEGTLRFLWLVALLQSPSLTTITLIDEPEVSLHPEMLQLLVDLMREASSRTQLIVATHSDRLIRFADPSEVLVVDLQDGGASLTWADTLDLGAWLEDYSLDQLWQMNRLGGRP